MSIIYHNIDLFKFIDENPIDKKIICHCVNNVGKMGSGFVVPLYTRWPQVKSLYHKWDQRLGETQFVYVENEDDDSLVVVANMCAQNGISGKSTGPQNLVNKKPIRYLALTKCMFDVSILARKTGSAIVAPKFGSDRAGGTWLFIEELIEEFWDGIEIHICYL
jgi:hypothetical protein